MHRYDIQRSSLFIYVYRLSQDLVLLLFAGGLISRCVSRISKALDPLSESVDATESFTTSRVLAPSQLFRLWRFAENEVRLRLTSPKSDSEE